MLSLLGGAAAVAAGPPLLTSLPRHTSGFGGRRLHGTLSGSPAALVVPDTACTLGARLQAKGVTVSLADIQKQPLYLQAMRTDRLWQNERINLCTGASAPAPGPVRIAYTFDDLGETYLGTDAPTDPSVPHFAPFTPVLRRALTTLLRQVESVAAVQFIELTGADAVEANLCLRIDNSPTAPGAYASGILSDQPSVLGMTRRELGPEFGTLYRNGLQHELMHALSFSHTDGASLTQVALPQGNWENNARSTVLATPGCHTGNEGLGPLDFALLVSAYGPAARAAGDDIILIAPTMRPEGRIDTLGANTLRVQGDQVCSASLKDDGTSATVIGQADILLAPGSRVDSVDISRTRGGLVIGNDRANRMEASAGNDLIDPGLGDDTVTTGPGQDIVVVRAGPGLLTITDFEPGQDTLGITFPGPLPALTRLGNSTAGATYRLDFAQGRQVILQCPASTNLSLAQTLRRSFTYTLPEPCASISNYLATIAFGPSKSAVDSLTPSQAGVNAQHRGSMLTLSAGLAAGISLVL